MKEINRHCSVSKESIKDRERKRESGWGRENSALVSYVREGVVVMVVCRWELGPHHHYQYHHQERPHVAAVCRVQIRACYHPPSQDVHRQTQEPPWNLPPGCQHVLRRLHHQPYLQATRLQWFSQSRYKVYGFFYHLRVQCFFFWLNFQSEVKHKMLREYLYKARLMLNAFKYYIIDLIQCEAFGPEWKIFSSLRP